MAEASITRKDPTPRTRISGSSTTAASLACGRSRQRRIKQIPSFKRLLGIFCGFEEHSCTDPIRQDPVNALAECTVLRMYSSISSSVAMDGEGYTSSARYLGQGDKRVAAGQRAGSGYAASPPYLEESVHVQLTRRRPERCTACGRV